MRQRIGTIERMNAARACRPASGGKIYQRATKAAGTKCAPGAWSSWEDLFATMIQAEHENVQTFLRVTGIRAGDNLYMTGDDLAFCAEGF